MEDQNTVTLTLEIDESDYRGDIHSSLPPAIYSELEEGNQEYKDVFGLTDLNRYLNEGSQAGSGWTVEDFAISSSALDGELIVGQCISAREKEDDFEHKQVMGLKYTLMNFHPETYERLNGSYIIAVDNSVDEVREVEEEVEEEIYENGSAEVNIRVTEVEEVPPSIDGSLQVLSEMF